MRCQAQTRWPLKCSASVVISGSYVVGLRCHAHEACDQVVIARPNAAATAEGRPHALRSLLWTVQDELPIDVTGALGYPYANESGLLTTSFSDLAVTGSSQFIARVPERAEHPSSPNL